MVTHIPVAMVTHTGSYGYTHTGSYGYILEMQRYIDISPYRDTLRP